MTHGQRASAPGPTDTYRFLLGDWRIERTYTEHRLHERATFRGTVSVVPVAFAEPVVMPPAGVPPAGVPPAGVPSESPDAGTARYHEAGRFHLGAYEGDGERRLVLVRQQGGTALLTFEDGRPFVGCDLSSGHYRATHRCRDDRYEISWEILSHDAVAERWRVGGPHKSYEAWAVLHRMPPTRPTLSPSALQ